jgi:hypothetical protein
MFRWNLQHPCEIPVEIGINSLHIRQYDLLPQDHLVESSNEECVQESPVEDG